MTDPFIPFAMTGIVVNIAPPAPRTPTRARILWDNDCACMMDATDFAVTSSTLKFAIRPVMMEPFVRSAA